MSKINFIKKFELINEHWSPKIIAQMNDYHFKLAKIKGEFTWHLHEETDEVFIVIEGSMRMDYEDEQIEMKKDEMIVVPKGKLHKPYSEKGAQILLIEPAGTVNTGNIQDTFTKKEVDWI